MSLLKRHNRYSTIRPIAYFPVSTFAYSKLVSQKRPRVVKKAGAEETGMRREKIGTSQMWHYPADGVAVIWEAYLSEAFRAASRATDTNMQRLWVGIEDYVLTHFPDTTQVTTPFRHKAL